MYYLFYKWLDSIAELLLRIFVPMIVGDIGL